MPRGKGSTAPPAALVQPPTAHRTTAAAASAGNTHRRHATQAHASKTAARSRNRPPREGELNSAASMIPAALADDTAAEPA